MTRGHPCVGSHAVVAKDLEAADKLVTLDGLGQPGKFTAIIDTHDSRLPGFIAVLKTVQGNAPAGSLSFTYPGPEIRPRCVHVELGIWLSGTTAMIGNTPYFVRMGSMAAHTVQFMAGQISSKRSR
jgi:hypothetical protein